MREGLPEAEPDAAEPMMVPDAPVDGPEGAVVVVPAGIADPPVAGTGPAHQRWVVPVPRAPDQRRGCWWFFGGVAVGIVVGTVVAGVALFPLVREELRQRNLRYQATSLVATAHQQLLVGQADAAESRAREALELVPGYPAAEQMVASVNALRERNRQREEDGAAALAAAEKLAAGDEILAALAAFRGMR
ncbi:MAG: hypothetical protein K9N23_09355, partial [Akkermansiaceae bacterium]|nr:hypothetical protein [Akkermansiaceae bacterium]